MLLRRETTVKHEIEEINGRNVVTEFAFANKDDILPLLKIIIVRECRFCGEAGLQR